MDIVLFIGLPLVGVLVAILINAGVSAFCLQLSCRIRNKLFAGNNPARAVNVPTFRDAFEIGVDLLLLAMVLTVLSAMLGFVIGWLVGGAAAIPVALLVVVILLVVSFCCQSSIIAEGIETSFGRAAGVNFFFNIALSIVTGLGFLLVWLAIILIAMFLV